MPNIRMYTPRARLLRAGTLFVLLAVVLPNVLYLGHGPTEAHSHEAVTAGEPDGEGDEHAQHCHVGPSKCAGQQSLVGTWWAGDPSPIPEPGLTLTTFGSIEVSAIDALPAKLLRPPQTTLSS